MQLKSHLPLWLLVKYCLNMHLKSNLVRKYHSVQSKTCVKKAVKMEPSQQILNTILLANRKLASHLVSFFVILESVVEKCNFNQNQWIKFMQIVSPQPMCQYFNFQILIEFRSPSTGLVSNVFIQKQKQISTHLVFLVSLNWKKFTENWFWWI